MQTSRGHAARRDAAAILRLGAPLLVANLALAGMPLADTLMAGQLGASALAAIAVGSSFYGLCMYFGLGVMTAFSPLTAHAYGAGSKSAIGEYSRQGFWVVAFLSVALTSLLWLVGPFLQWIGTDPAIVPMARDYVHAISFGMPGLLAAHGLRSMSEGVGRTRPVMGIALVALAANIFLNWVFMYGHLGAPALGAVGTGIATALAQWCMALMYAVWMRFGRMSRTYEWIGAPARPDAAKIREIAALGLPIGGAMLAETALFSSAGLMVGTLGATTVAAHQIALNYASFTFMAPVSLHSATTIHVGHAMGGRDLAGARRAGWVGILLCGALMALSALLIFFEHGAIAALYTRDLEVSASASGLLVLAGIFQLSDGLQVGAMGALRGLKDARVPMAITLAAYWGIGFPIAYTAGIARGGGPTGVWCGLIAGLTVAAALLIWRYDRVSRLKPH